MRLNPFNTDNIDVRGGSSRFPGGGAGQLGCGTLIIAGIVSLLFGTDFGQTVAVIDTVNQTTGSGQVSNADGQMSEQELCTSSDYATEACNALQSLNKTWEPVFAQAFLPHQSDVGQRRIAVASPGAGARRCQSTDRAQARRR